MFLRDEDDYFIIFSDSLSVLLSLHNMKVDNLLILKTLQNLHDLSCARKTIHLCWIPSHIGIRGNEAADMSAKDYPYSKYYCYSSSLYRLKMSHQPFHCKQMARTLVVLP